MVNVLLNQNKLNSTALLYTVNKNKKNISQGEP